MNAAPLVREGKLRAFAVTSRKRSVAAPDLPTMIEMGYPDFEAVPWFGLMAPTGTPQAIIDKAAARHRDGARDAGRAQAVRGQGLDVIGGTPAEFAGRDQDRDSLLGEDHQGSRHQGEE